MSEEPAPRSGLGADFRATPGQDSHAVPIAPIACIRDQNRDTGRPSVIRRGASASARPAFGTAGETPTARRRRGGAGRAMPRPSSGRAAGCLW
jgi:hypothetical protein